MSFNIEELRKLPDDELIKLHDSAAKNTVVGVNYYLEELKRREQVNQIENLLQGTMKMLEVIEIQSKQIHQMSETSSQMVELSQGQSIQTDKMLGYSVDTVNYSRKMFWLTVIVTVATIINLLVAVMFYLKS